MPELLALCANLSAVGYHPGDVVTRIEAITAALDAAANPDPARWLTGDLVSLDPAAVVERTRQAGLDLACWREMARVRTDVEARLAADAAAALRESSDGIIARMRKRFDPAVKVVRAAADAGLTPHTDTAQLLDTAPGDVITAYRDLAPAVAELDRIASLRNSRTSVAAVGPVDHPMAALLTDVADLASMEGAQQIWRGETEVVQVDQTFGSSLARVRRPRLGGPWLALVVAGYTLHLNTASEADEVLAKASG